MQIALAQKVVQVQQAIQADPVYFLDEFTGQSPWSKQAQVIRSVFANPVTTVRSCHDAGKSWIAAESGLAFLTAWVDSYVITTAPTFRQVEHILWREIASSYRKSRYPLGGRLYEQPLLELGDNWFAIGISTKEPDRLQGLHSPSGRVLVIADEASGIAEEIFVGIDSILTSEGARLLMIGNPTSITGRFYDSHHKDPSAKRVHISCFDTPNFTNNGIRNLQDLMSIDMNKIEIVAPYLITPQWVKDKVYKWGVDSPMFQARCLGEFPTAEANTLIPLNMIEAAATPERHAELEPGEHFVGVDPARYGDDKTVITERLGPIVEPQQVSSKEDITATAGRIKLLKSAEGIFTDADGLGAGVADVLRDDKIDNVIDIHGSASPYPDDTGLNFVNFRAQLYWHVAELFKRGEIAIPDDPELHSQLASIRYTVTRRGIQIESKDEIKKRLGISPDKADSLVYSFADFMMQGEKIQARAGKSYDQLYKQHGAE